MLERLDQHVHRLLFEVNQDFLEGRRTQGHFGGDVNPDFAQGAGLFLKPLAVALDVAHAHLLQGLFVDQTGGRQAFQIIEGDDVQRGVFGLGQRGGLSKAGLCSISGDATSMKRD